MEPEKPKNATEPSLGTVLGEIGESAKELIRSEVELLKIEIKDSAKKLGKHSTQVAIFGLLCIVSILPLTAFLVIGLGKILNENYWLSSLIIGLIYAATGGILALTELTKKSGKRMWTSTTVASALTAKSELSKKI
jgi:hypothetical protein